jgi:hypothetical protein
VEGTAMSENGEIGNERFVHEKSNAEALESELRYEQ